MRDGEQQRHGVVGDGLRVGTGRPGEGDAATLEAKTEFAVVIDLAIEAEHHAAGCICHRLRASGGKIENR